MLCVVVLASLYSCCLVVGWLASGSPTAVGTRLVVGWLASGSPTANCTRHVAGWLASGSPTATCTRCDQRFAYRFSSCLMWYPAVPYRFFGCACSLVFCSQLLRLTLGWRPGSALAIMDAFLEVAAAADRDFAKYLQPEPGAASRAASPSASGAVASSSASGDASSTAAVAHDPYLVEPEPDYTIEGEGPEPDYTIEELPGIDDTEPPSPFQETGESEGDRLGKWIVRPNKRGRSDDLTDRELEGLRHEQRAAEMAGMSWKERGPAGAVRPDCWRGQALRKGKDGGEVRYANRGGKHKEYYQALAKAGKLVHVAKGKATAKGKGSGKHKDKGQTKH
jgi:hypothetical protein